MTKIEFNNNEQVFMEGSVSYLKSKINVLQGTGYLTSKRFIFCKRNGLMNALLGGLLVHLVKGKNIMFEINLDNVESINGLKHGFAKKYILKDKSGNEYALQFIRKDKWLTAIKEAIKFNNPLVNINQVGDYIQFKL